MEKYIGLSFNTYSYDLEVGKKSRLGDELKIISKCLDNRDEPVTVYYKNVNTNKKNIIFIVSRGNPNYITSFILNCLCLSDSIVIENMDIDEKLKIIIKYLSKSNRNENCFLLRCFIDPRTSIFSEDNGKNFYFYEIETIKRDLVFQFHNSKIIYCYNDRLFNSIIFDNQIKTTLKEYINFSTNSKEKIEKKFNEKKLTNDSSNYLNNRFLCNWNVNWFFSKDDVLKNIKRIYWILGLDGYNEDIIGNYYDYWIDTLNDISKESIIIKNENILS